MYKQKGILICKKEVYVDVNTILIWNIKSIHFKQYYGP